MVNIFEVYKKQIVKNVLILYHVTRNVNAKVIANKGMYPGMPHSEGGLASAIATNEYLENWEENEEEQAREAFDQFMNEAAMKYPNKPRHNNAVFFFSNINDANYSKLKIDSYYGAGSGKIIKVDASKINCTLWEADWHLSDRLFSECLNNLDDAQLCLEGLNESKCSRFDRLAERYYRQMKIWDGKPKPGIEVIAGCIVPKEAIVNIE
ncbi:MAG: hypothetical protein QXL94_01830 [Candidatus Parvarchaeum sp.]